MARPTLGTPPDVKMDPPVSGATMRRAIAQAGLTLGKVSGQIGVPLRTLERQLSRRDALPYPLHFTLTALLQSKDAP